MSAFNASCDTASIAARPAGRSDHPRLVLATTILASSLAFIDGSVVNVGLPAIGRSLHPAAGELPWVINAYLLPLSALLLFGGAMGDRFGRRLLLVLGTVVFALASAACALAPSMAVLLAARVAQGAGAAMLMPNSLAILGDAFEGEARGKAIGTWAAVAAMAGAIGPVIGGWLIDTVGWRAIFLVNLPVAAGAVILAWRYVRETPSNQRAPLDLPGAVLATLGLGGLTWGLTIGAGPVGWTATAIGLTSAGAVLLAAFVLVEHRRGDRAMMPLALFASRNFVGLTLLTLLLYGALGALLVLVPYELIEAEHYSATAAGAALLPFPLVMSVASPALGALAGRVGARIPLIGGSAIVAAGFLLATRIGPGGGYWTTVAPAVLVMSVGMAGVAAPLTTAVLASVDSRHTGSASGFNSAVARTGGLIATALLGAVLAAKGAALTSGFRTALIACALAAAAAAVCGFVLIRPIGRSRA
ncbi:MAG TPA: MFS transporter [Caulobacteraceae bacterium]|nr:MFS transporter [Caulobacteraceae bacterium]